MTIWSPEWRVSLDSDVLTDVTLANLSITSGRTDLFAQPVAGYCHLELINLNNTTYDYSVGTQVTIEIKDSSGTYLPIFGGYLTDMAITVAASGHIGYTTKATITALGALSKLPKIIDEGVLSKDYEGNQIYSLLQNYLLGQWNEVPASATWATYDPTETWLNAVNIGLGEIDRPGKYEMINRSASNTNLYSLVAQIAQSGFGYIYEDASGNIGYADTTHRQVYLANNGYVELDANQALSGGIATSIRSADIRNQLVLSYGNNAGSHYTADDLASQTAYGIISQQATSNVDKTADAIALSDRYLALRSTPQPKFESITFQLANPEIDNSDRDALLATFMGQPIWIKNLPANIASGSFQGFVEGWTFRASYNQLSVTLTASPLTASLSPVPWNEVAASEAWNTLSAILTWENAIGEVA